MRLIKIASYVILIFCFIVYVIVKSRTYSLNVENFNLDADLTSINNENDELQIQLTTNLSRTELMEKYPELELHDNIYYIEEEDE